MDGVMLFCRFCAQEKPNEKLFHLETDPNKCTEVQNQLKFMNANYVDFSLQNSLPKTVCFVCSDLLNKAYEFLNSVREAQIQLQAFQASNSNVKVELNSEENFDETGADDIDLDVKFDENDEKPLIEHVKREAIDYEVINDDNCPTHYKILRKKPRKLKRLKKKLISSRKCNRDQFFYDLELENFEQDYDCKETWQDYIWRCQFCNKILPDIKSLKLHSLVEHDTCSAFKCIDCDQKQSNFNNFLKHVRSHRKHLTKTCYICNYQFLSLESAKLHYKKEHFRKLSKLCSGCGEIFATINDRKQHEQKYFISETDLSQSDLTCRICSKAFKSRGNLAVHMQIHSERQRNHTCEKCGKTFFNKGTLNSHMILHEDIRPFKCEICTSAFKTSTQLRSHVGIHGGQRPYSCEQCGRSFRLRCHLKSHLIIHTDSMPHTCEYCGKAFRFKTILTQHLRQHTGAKPYSCEQCMRDFTNWPNYNKHMKRRHGLDMSKKKHTPDGVVPVNPLTGQLLELPLTIETEEWKKKIMLHKKPGRPKVKVENSIEDDKEKNTISLETT